MGKTYDEMLEKLKNKVDELDEKIEELQKKLDEYKAEMKMWIG